MKYVKYFFLVILILISLLCVSGFIISKFYGEEVKHVIIAELNKKLVTEIAVEQVDFSIVNILKNFPNASIEFHHVLAKSSPTFNKKDFKCDTDTLFAFDKLSLQFNIKDIWVGNYTLNQIYAKGGKINILLDKKGNGNYNFWKEDTESDSSAIAIKINNLEVENLDIFFIDKLNGISVDTYQENVQLIGNFSADEYSLYTKGDLFFRSLIINTINYISFRKVFVETEFYVNHDNYKIKKGNLRIAGLNFILAGDIKARENTSLTLDVKGDNIDIQSFLSLLPQDLSNYTKSYQSSGDFYFDTHIEGLVGNGQFPHIETQFGVSHGEISKTDSEMDLKNVNLTGRFTNGRKNSSTTAAFILENFSFLLKENTLSGTFSLDNFSNPVLQFDVNADFNLADLQLFIKIDTIAHLEGKFNGNVKFVGQIDDLDNFGIEDFRRANTEGKLNVKNIEVKLKGSPTSYENISGSLTFKNNDMQIDSLHLRFDKTDFDLDGYLKNVLGYMFVDSQHLSIEGNVATDRLDLYKFLYSESTPNQAETLIDLPEDIDFNLNMRIKNFEYKKLSARHVKGNLKYRNRKIIVNNLIFNTMNGTVLGDLEVIQMPDNNLSIRTNATINGMDVTQLFYSFENFGQDFIIDKHLKGTITSKVYFSSVWSPAMVPDPDKFYIESDLEISDGELIDFEPMLELSRFIEVSELKHIKFSTLKNTVLIDRQQINIPTMTIQSSALNLDITGVHSFTNEFSYSLKLLLSDVLFKKAKKKKENTDFGVVEDDGLGRTSLYLTISGNPDDIKIAYNRRQAKEVLKENYLDEKKEIKTILNKEFGWFNRDSLIQKNREEKKDSVKHDKLPFKIVWDDE